MATVIKGGTAYAGITAAVSSHTDESFSSEFMEAVFNSTNVLKALGIEAKQNKKSKFSSTNVEGGVSFPQFHGHQMSGKLAIDAPETIALEIGGSAVGAERNDWTGWSYSSKRLFTPLAIPEEYVIWNQGEAQLASMLSDEMRLAQMSITEQISKVFLGAADAKVSAVGLPYLVSVSQTHSVGEISTTNSYWQNWKKSVPNAGGGGEFDLPLNLRNAIQGAFVGASKFASAGDKTLLISNPGAYMTMCRLANASVVGPGLAGMVSTTHQRADFFEAGIGHILVNGVPMVFDQDATMPLGGNAGDFIYGINTSTLGIAFQKAVVPGSQGRLVNRYVVMEDWMAPNPQSDRRFFKANLGCMMVPYTKRRDENFVIHGIEANTASVSD